MTCEHGVFAAGCCLVWGVPRTRRRRRLHLCVRSYFCSPCMVAYSYSLFCNFVCCLVYEYPSARSPVADKEATHLYVWLHASRTVHTDIRRTCPQASCRSMCATCSFFPFFCCCFLAVVLACCVRLSTAAGREFPRTAGVPRRFLHVCFLG